MDEANDDVVTRIYLACGELSSQDKLTAISIAWLSVAKSARSEALIVPGGFPEERARQVEVLRRMVDLTETDTPDLEMERLFQEGDIEGMRQHLKKTFGTDAGPDS